MIPDNLWLGVVHQSFREDPPSGPRSDEVRGRCAVTYWMQADADGFSQELADSLLVHLISLWNPIPGLGWLSEWFFLDKVTVQHVASEQGKESLQDIRIGTAFSPPVPMQAAILVIGRTDTLRRQVRHWLAGWPASGIDEHGRPRSADKDHGNRAWCKNHLLPFTTFGHLWTPICWDADNQVVRPITSHAISTEWRTQRRRSLQGQDDIDDM